MHIGPTCIDECLQALAHSTAEGHKVAQQHDDCRCGMPADMQLTCVLFVCMHACTHTFIRTCIAYAHIHIVMICLHVQTCILACIYVVCTAAASYKMPVQSRHKYLTTAYVKHIHFTGTVDI